MVIISVVTDPADNKSINFCQFISLDDSIASLDTKYHTTAEVRAIKAIIPLDIIYNSLINEVLIFLISIILSDWIQTIPRTER